MTSPDQLHAYVLQAMEAAGCEPDRRYDSHRYEGVRCDRHSAHLWDIDHNECALIASVVRPIAPLAYREGWNAAIERAADECSPESGSQDFARIGGPQIAKYFAAMVRGLAPPTNEGSTDNV